MVKVPVATTLPAEVPLIVPMRPLEMTATLAGPPRAHPAIAKAKSTKYVPTRETLRNAEKAMKRMM